VYTQNDEGDEINPNLRSSTSNQAVLVKNV